MATSINWPFTTGQARCWLLADYDQTPPDLIDSMATPVGSVDWLIGSTGPVGFNVSVILSLAEHAQIAGWLRHEIGYTGAPLSGAGNKWFNAQVLSDGTLEPRELRFIRGSISFKPLGACWVQMSAQVRTRVGTEMDAGTYELVKQYGYAGAEDLFNYFNGFAEQRIPAPTFSAQEA